MGIAVADLQELAKSRFADAVALYDAKRYAGAVYLCGYAVELALKARITHMLDWQDGWPETRGDFKQLESFKTHDLAILLKLSSLEMKLKADKDLNSAFQAVAQWDPETRYKVADKSAGEDDARTMIDNCKLLLSFLAI